MGQALDFAAEATGRYLSRSHAKTRLCTLGQDEPDPLARRQQIGRHVALESTSLSALLGGVHASFLRSIARMTLTLPIRESARRSNAHCTHPDAVRVVRSAVIDLADCLYSYANALRR